jgi:hypothetical protein
MVVQRHLCSAALKTVLTVTPPQRGCDRRVNTDVELGVTTVLLCQRHLWGGQHTTQTNSNSNRQNQQLAKTTE